MNSPDEETPEDILAWLDEKPTLSRFVGAARRLDDLATAQFRTVDALVVRNFTIEPIEPLLKVAGYRAGLRLAVRYSGYDPSADDRLGERIGAGADVVLLALRVEELAPAISRDFLKTGSGAAAEIADGAVDHVLTLAAAIRSRSSAAILVHNFVTPVAAAAGIGDAQDPGGQLNMVRRMNLDLATRIHSVDGAYIVDVDHLFARLGLREAADSRGGRLSDAPLSQPALRTLADAYVQHIRALRGPSAKCIVVDCDNTLWGGVIGEDGLAGILLGEVGPGRKHWDLQQTLLDLRRRGVILAVSSKNEEFDVLNVLRSHPDCLLGEADFAASRINWDDKADNIASIAKELNIGLEHVVFVDDNPVECEWVKARLPEVRVIPWPGGIPDGGTLDDLGLFDSLITTEEDRSRTEMYHAEAKRRAARAEITSVDDYLRSLRMVATIGRARPEHLARVAQLTQKTNQFNVTTRRYDIAAIEQFASDDRSAVLWLDLTDRFGSNGIVGCAILRRTGTDAVIDTLLLSCRVLGRGAESVLVNRLGILARDMGAAALVGEYVPSERNAQVADLYERLGFASDGATWRWPLAHRVPALPDWFELVVDEGRA